MPEETIYCEMCWTNPNHAHLRGMPICGQCVEEFNIMSGLKYLDIHPYENLDGQRMTEAEAMASSNFPHFSPRSSEELSVARLNILIGAS